jgi:alpha-maltose-1-phosphate synthase
LQIRTRKTEYEQPSQHILNLLLSHLTGNPNSRNTALALVDADWLQECHHTLAWTSPLSSNSAFFPSTVRTLWNRRTFPELPAEKLHSHPWPELARLACRNLNIPLLGPFLRHRYSLPNLNRRFDAAVASRVTQSTQLTGVYGYFDTSLQTFRAAKAKGLRTFYELPTPYWKTTERLLAAESKHRPEWAATLPSSTAFASVGPHRDAELQLADVIIVPSPFVRDSLQEAPSFKAEVVVIPYGCPEPTTQQPPQNQEPRTKNQELLKLLFVGTLSQSKGLADLLEAIEPLGAQIQLTVAGSCSCPDSSLLPPFPSSVRQLGQLPHADLLAELPQHDLLVLPTLYEGLSLAVLEALSRGLPVLTTTHSGFDGLVQNGRQMILISPGDPTELRAQIQRVMNQPEILTHLAKEGLAWANTHTWAHYRQTLVRTLEPHLK